MKRQKPRDAMKEGSDGFTRDDEPGTPARVGQAGAHSTGGSPRQANGGPVTSWAPLTRSGRQQNAQSEATALAFQESAPAVDRRKNEFLSILGHELRNPVAAAMASVAVLRTAPPEARDRAVDVLDRQLHHLARLIDDLVAVSRVTRGAIELQRERLVLQSIVGQALEQAKPFVERRRHHVTLSSPDRPIALVGDPVRITQALANVIDNAAKFCEPGGRIAIRLEVEPGWAVVSVADSGIGIPAEALPRVFDPFAQVNPSLDRRQAGLGLGLTVARRLVEMHGGTITASSGGPAQGSEFTIRLPRPTAEEGAPDVPHEEQMTESPRRLRVLVVDDNRDSADMMALLIATWGHDTEVAHEGPAALQMARELEPDLILLDVGLPGLNGLDVARQLKADPTLASTVIAAMTGYGGEDDRRRSREAGFDRHLVKPVMPEVLRALLDETRAKIVAAEDRTR